MPQTHFTNIKQAIMEQLQYAQTSVYVLVAWFTDAELFDVLCELQQKHKVQVSVLINNDDINQNSGIDYERLNTLGGNIYLLGSSHTGRYSKIHHKFCVIDGKNTIVGSYNWTNQAKLNEESIVVIEDDTDTALDFIEQFNNLANSNPQNEVQGIVIQRARNLIKELDNGNIKKIEQTYRKFESIVDVQSDSALKYLKTAIENKDYHLAVSLINQYIGDMMKITVWVDPEIAILQAEIRCLEFVIQELETKKQEFENLKYQFNVLYHQRLGKLLKKVLEEEVKQTERIQAQNQQAQTQHQEAQKRLEQFSSAYDEASKIDIKELSESLKAELKRLFRKGAKLCHPDKFASEEEKNILNSWFVKLNEANQKNDIDAVMKIVEDLENGNYKNASNIMIKTDLDTLKKLVDLLVKQKEELDEEMSEIMKEPLYYTIIERNKWNEVFQAHETALNNKLNKLTAHE